MNIKIDPILGLQRGDEGKGKVCHSLLSQRRYTHSLRFNGSGNAGHSIYHNGKKFVTHLIPAGVFYGVKSIIGPGCVLNVRKLFEEIEELEANGISTKNLIKVARNAHIVTEEHMMEESNESKVGTTKMGVGPAYTAKYARRGIRAESIKELQEFIIDMHDEFHDGTAKRVLAEGAQAFYLDVDWGDYPYVTSSHCGIGGVLLNGFSHKSIGLVYGVVKAYETYVGARQFEPKNDPIFAEIRKVGQEFGATTGRPRQCNWLNLDELTKAIDMNSPSCLIINKIDILREVNVWKLIHGGQVINLHTEEKFRNYIDDALPTYVEFSDNPNDI